MDPEVVIVGDDGTEHVFPAGFDPVKAAAIVRGEAPASSGMTTPAVVAGLAAAKAAPAILSGVNTAASGVGKAASVLSKGGVVPALAVLDGYEDFKRGNYGQAAMKVGAASAPTIAKTVGRATGPLSMAARGAGWLSRFAGAAAVPVTLASLLMDAMAQEEELTANQSIDPAEKALIRQRLARPFEQ